MVLGQARTPTRHQAEKAILPTIRTAQRPGANSSALCVNSFPHALQRFSKYTPKFNPASFFAVHEIYLRQHNDMGTKLCPARSELLGT